MADLQELVQALQRDLAQVDLLTRPSRSPSGFVEFLILKSDNLKFKIYKEPGHNLPHIHIDYGKNHHAASYGIDPAVRLAGNLASKYDRSVLAWIANNRGTLLALWQALQTGTDANPLAVALQGDA